MRLLMVMAISVRENLRKRSLGDEALKANLELVAHHLTPEEFEEYKNVVKNRPLLVMSWIGKFVHQAYIDKLIKDPSGQILMSFDSNVSALLRGWMGMNKVCYQPVPFPYVHTLHWFIMVWLITLPFVLVAKAKYWTILILALVAVALMAIEEVSEEIEDPFGDDLNDLPTENFEIGLIRDAGMVLNQHTGPMAFRCKVEEGLEKRGMFVPKVDYTPVGLSAKDVMSDEAEAASPPVPTMQQQESVDAVVMDVVQTKSPLEPEQVAPSIENKAQLAERVPTATQSSKKSKSRRASQVSRDDAGGDAINLAIDMMSPKSGQGQQQEQLDHKQHYRMSPKSSDERASNRITTDRIDAIDFGENRY